MIKKGALSNVRIVDLTRVWAGPLATRILADMGAEVIKIGDPRVPVERASGINNKLNRNKLGLALRLDEPEAQDIFKQLVSISDVVIENFRPRVMRNFGLTYDVLKQVKPDIIMASMPGFGTTGDYADFPAFGPSVETLTGITSLMAYPGGPPRPSAMAYPDPVASLNGASAVMTALWHRRRTGKGQYIDLSLAEGPISQLGEFVVAYSATGTLPEPVGSGHLEFAPYGCYPAMGEDRWITICVTSEEQWEALCDTMGQPEWARERAFSDQASRWQHRQELDALIGEWTSQQDSHQLMGKLQQRGVPAGAVLDGRDMLENPHLDQRGFFVNIDEPDVGPIRYAGQPIRMSATPSIDEHRPSPILGEHSRRILTELLQFSDKRVTELGEQGIIGTADISN